MHARHAALESEQKDKKPEDLTDAEKDDMKKCNEEIANLESKRKEVWASYGKGNKIASQLVDLALLQNGLLRGEALNKFVNRSVELIK